MNTPKMIHQTQKSIECASFSSYSVSRNIISGSFAGRIAMDPSKQKLSGSFKVGGNCVRCGGSKGSALVSTNPPLVWGRVADDARCFDNDGTTSSIS
jgi:hypothetical protein